MRSWRSGAKVEKRLLSQWFVKTTAYAEQLMSELTSGNLKEGWRDIIDLQKHWIGSIRGYCYDTHVSVKDILVDDADQGAATEEPLRVWFSDLPALKDSKYFILKPDHFLATRENAISKVLENGVKLLKFTLENPLTGEKLPVFTGPPETMPLVPESSDCRTSELLSEDFGDLCANEGMLNSLSEINLEKTKSVSDIHLYTKVTNNILIVLFSI